MFAIGFSQEREVMLLEQVPAALVGWLQNAGALAAIGLVLWCTAYYSQNRGRRPAGSNLIFLALTGLSFVLFLTIGVLLLANAVGIRVGNLLPATNPSLPPTTGDMLLAVAGGSALLAVVYPMLVAVVTRWRWGRIWAMARLSLKEAIRSRVLFVFAVLALIFLFAEWFVPHREEDQLRNFVRLVYGTLFFILILPTTLLGAFSIPTDVKNQSIHTIVTKPVERFEIVLGRFLGYGTLLTVGLAVMAGLSLLYIARGIHEEARRETYKARVPIYGQLSFLGTKEKDKGSSVGRIHELRSYIAGPTTHSPNAPRQYAVWSFDELPSELGARADDTVTLEYSFDIFRLSKGIENRGVFCTFVCADGRFDMQQIGAQLEAARKERLALKDQAIKSLRGTDKLDQRLWEIDNELALKYGVHEAAATEVTDYHTQALNIPRQLFTRLNESEGKNPRQVVAGAERPPMMRLLVSVDRITATDMLGVARNDAYILAAERPFWLNFFKGIFGMWCVMMLVLGIAVTCSTYLSGVISWLCAIFLCLAGAFAADIQALAENKVGGGGPAEAAYRVLRGTPESVALDNSPSSTLLLASDEVYRWWLRRVITLIPDVNRYDLTHYVANGFDIPLGEVLSNMLFPLLGYLIPCAVFAFYMMRFREIANPT